MLTISEVAERDGVSKQAVSKSVKRLVESGLQVERNAQGHIVRLNVAQYDLLRGRFGDPSKDQRPARSEPTPDVREDESLNEARRVQAWIEAERSKISLAEDKQQLVRVASLVDAAVTCGEALVRIVDGLGNEADDIAAACGRDGVHGVRVKLKQIATKLREQIAQAMEGIATTQPKPPDQQQ